MTVVRSRLINVEGGGEKSMVNKRKGPAKRKGAKKGNRKKSNRKSSKKGSRRR